MKFIRWEANLQSRNYVILEPCDVPVQLRIMDEPGDRATILANAQGYRFLKDLFLIVGAMKQPNCLFVVRDNSPKLERFQFWYPGGAFHKGLILSHHGHVAMTGKAARKVLAMKKYAKQTQVSLQAPAGDFQRLPHWGLENALHVHPHGKWILLASNFEGYLYMAREADGFLNIPDDPEETFAHAHLFFLTQMEDRLDMRYYYQAPQHEAVHSEVTT